jgi:diaminohydroxyphosphoribosylaminopyrimidine deaminase/5-amino-6-(5-phosphoribosylamino)uracil reductase
MASNFDFMQQALQLAEQATFLSNPNPRVGCVIASPSGQVLGQGFTQKAGGPHAEVVALRDAAARGHEVLGACVYVTLEPCSHHGRTPPCCDALVAAGVAKVIVACQDPNPRVAGQGIARLRAAGIEVQVLPADDPHAIAMRELNIGFFSRMLRGLPWVRLKMAASLDGTSALANGASQWITSAEARADGHAWRARACAILTGVGTVLADDPRLDVRAVATPRQPHVAVLDSQMRTPPDAHFFIAARACYIYGCGSFDAQIQARKTALEARGTIVVPMACAQGRVDVAAVVRDLAQREVNELHVEAGPTLSGALLQAGLVDELLCYLAPKLLGPGRRMFDLAPRSSLAQALPFEFHRCERVGPDLRILARLPGRAEF